jgi:hypothetical protein
MSAGNQNISVNFKVSGGELSQYIDSIQKKSDKLTQSAIAGALAQSTSSKEQLKIINDQVAALEKKARVEAQAMRSVTLENRGKQIQENKEYYEGKRTDVDKAKNLTKEQKSSRIEAIDIAEKESEQRVKSDYKENLTVLKEQERQQKLQTQLAKENVDTLKQTARENVKAIMNGDKKLEDVIGSANTEEEKLVAKLTEEGVVDERKKQKKEEGSSGTRFLGSLLSVDNANRLFSSIQQLTQTQNGFDLIAPAANSFGRIAGGVIGGALAAIFTEGLGVAAGAGIGASIGGGLGDTYGSLKQREELTKQKFLQTKNRYNSITGEQLSNAPNMENIGIASTQFVQLQADYAKRRGYRDGSGKTTQDALYAERGFGVDQSTSSAIIEMMRSSKSNNRDLANLIGGVLEKGASTFFKNGDTTFLNEFLNKFSALQKELLRTQTNVATGTTFDILSKFNSLGGEFATSDPRSSGLINTINGSLANPNTDFKKALSFYALKKSNPNMSIADLIEEQQKGISSPTYMNAMMGLVDQFGGDESSKRLNFAGMFGLEGNQKFATDLYKGFRSGKFKGGISQAELSGNANLQSRAEENTTQLEVNTAKIENAVLGMVQQ